MYLERIMLRERSQTQEITGSMIALSENPKKYNTIRTESTYICKWLKEGVTD